MPALAITDTNNLFGALEFSEKLAKAASSRSSAPRRRSISATRPPSFLRAVERDNARAPIVLLAQNEAGYRNLMRLVSGLWLDPTDGDEPHIPFAALRRQRRPHRADRRPGRPDRPGAESRTWRPRREPAQAPQRGVRLAALCRDPAPRARRASGRSSRRSSVSPTASGVPLVATNEPYFAYASDYEAHDALLCVAEGAVVSAAGAPPPVARASVQDPRRDDRALRRSPRGDRGQRRDRDALRLSAADAKADPAALFGRRRRRGRRGSRSCGARRARA